MMYMGLEWSINEKVMLLAKARVKKTIETDLTFTLVPLLSNEIPTTIINEITIKTKLPIPIKSLCLSILMLYKPYAINAPSANAIIEGTKFIFINLFIFVKRWGRQCY